MRFEPGQCITFTSRSARSACSRSVTQTQCAVHRRGVARPVTARYSRLECPPESRRTTSTSSRDSDACVCTSACSRADSAATASSSSREHDTANRGANAACSRPLAAPSQRFFSARLSSIDRVVCSRSLGGRVIGRVHHALADDGAESRRRQRLEDDVGVVDRFHRENGGGARQQELRCGQQRRRPQRRWRVRRFHRPDPALQPLEQRHVVRRSAKERLAQMDVRLDETRQEIPAAARR